MGEEEAIRERVVRLEAQVSDLHTKVAGVQTEIRKDGEFHDKQDHERRMQDLERDFSNTHQVVVVVKWLAASIVGSGILVGLTALIEGVS